MKTYMKIKNFTVFSLALLLMNNACTDHFEELNTPNNLVTEDLVNVDLMFTLVQNRSIVDGISSGRGTQGNYCGMSTNCDNNPFQYGDAPGTWNSAYGYQLNNLSEIIRLCQYDSETASDLVNKKAIARIMKAWIFSKVTDSYGDIPYFESCLPLDQAVFLPKYDSQKSIYEDLFKELKEAAAELDDSKDSYGSADLMYGGDVDKWKKLANSLRLRLALRVRYADAALATANMSDLTEADLITTRADDAYIYTCTDYRDNQNSEYNRIVDRQGIGETGCYNLGKTMLDILIGDGDTHNPADPRIGIYADTAKATWIAEYDTTFGYRGHALLGNALVENKYPYGGQSTSERPALWYVAVYEKSVMKCSEVYFALAEAALFGIKSGDANALYQQGIDKAIEWTQDFYSKCTPQMRETIEIFCDSTWTDADFNTYMAEKEVTQAEVDAFKLNAVYTLSGDQEQQFEQLMNQKLIAIYPDEFQGWTEWRRTGYPRVLVGPGDSVFPRRYRWPTNEQMVNSDSYAAALAQLGDDDDEYTSVWWDANTAAPHAHSGTVEWRALPWVGK